VLSEAEMLLGLRRHLAAYGASQPKGDLGQLEFAGQVLELSSRLRGSGVSFVSRVAALVADIGISKRFLHRELLPTLQQLGWADLHQGPDQEIQVVSERIPPPPEVFAQASTLLAVVMPEPVERAALQILRETTALPRTRDDLLARCSEDVDELSVQRALEDLESLHVLAHQQSADGTKVYFNPNVWAADQDYTDAALRAEDGVVRDALTGLLEEVSQSAGLPESDVTSAEDKWVNYAVAQGLLLRSLVKTQYGVEQAFLFSPHMGRSAFEQPTGVDPTGHVRQLLGSMAFANRYASNRLFWPRAFLSKLLRDGEAGDASMIATDYSMLEQAGIVRVEPATYHYKFVLLQGDIAEQAIEHLDAAESGRGSGGDGGLKGQSLYQHPDTTRARQRVMLGRNADPTPGATANILAALRQEAGRRRYGR
jgi:hypothetical protein